jgi:hypothetical protein
MTPKEYREQQIKKLISREYKIYQEEERISSLPRNIFEKSCRAAAKLNIKPDKKTSAKMQEAIDFAHMKITPTGVMSLTLLFILLFLLPTLFLVGTHAVFHQTDVNGKVVNELIVLNVMNETSTDQNYRGISVVSGFSGIPLGYGALIIFVGLFFTYYLYTYPYRLKRKYEVAAGAEIVTMILYMVMYMRNVPNLEGAVRFAAENLSGDLSYELRKMLWDVEVGNYLSMQDAIIEYTDKWKRNRPFVEAVQLLITSMKQVGEKRITMLDEAINIILEGNREQARHFNQKLKMPVTVVHALGIILPVMGLVMFPIVAVFLQVESSILFVGYDVILPMVLYFVITSILEIRPATFSKIDITDNPNVPPPGKIKMGNKFVKAWPIGLVVGLVIILLAPVAEAAVQTEGILLAVMICFGIALGFAIYLMLVSNPLLKVRSETRAVESEFAEALFQLGNQVGGGLPIEVSMQNSMERIKNLKIKNLFERAMKNIRIFGFTFQQAFFDEKQGALRLYPSKLIKSVMRTVVESSKKGVSVASIAMLTVSRYLKNLHQTQEDVKENLNDTLSSLKFQAYFLSPLISGIVTTLAIIIIRILRSLSEQSQNLGGTVMVYFDMFKDIPITPFEFVMIVGVYMIETSFILGMFINSIENGEDKIGQQNITGYALIIGFVIFMACLFLTLMIFGPLATAVATQ